MLHDSNTAQSYIACSYSLYTCDDLSAYFLKTTQTASYKCNNLAKFHFSLVRNLNLAINLDNYSLNEANDPLK